jgi:hypothetical protein
MAQETASSMIDGGWRTADALALSALAHESVGLHARAQEDTAAAIKITPHANERVSWVRDAMGAVL